MMKVLLVGALLALASMVSADVLIDTMPGDQYNIGYGGTIMQDYQGTDISQGNAFTVSGGDYTLTRVSAALSWVAGVNMIDLQLWDDNGGIPGTILESWTFTGLGTFGNYNAPVVGDSVLNPTLYNGMTYYLIAYAPQGPTWEVFNFANDNYGLNRYISWDDQNTWGNYGPDATCAFRIEVVPEPGFISLGGLLLGAAGILLRRK
jgi:opacity protein-like surface antigen